MRVPISIATNISGAGGIHSQKERSAYSQKLKTNLMNMIWQNMACRPSWMSDSNYKNAYNRATHQPDLQYYEVDKDGNMTQDHNIAIGQRIYVTNGIKTSTVIDWNYERDGKIE